MSIQSDVRVQLIGSNNLNVLSDEYIDLMYQDAVESSGTSDSLGLRYYTCYLIALNWESIGAVASREGVSFREPNPQKYLDLYNARMSQLASSSSSGQIAYKISTNKDLYIDEISNTTRYRRTSDED